MAGKYTRMEETWSTEQLFQITEDRNAFASWLPISGEYEKENHKTIRYDNFYKSFKSHFPSELKGGWGPLSTPWYMEFRTKKTAIIKVI